MTASERLIRTKVGMLELAKQLGNVSRAAKTFGYSRQSFYRIKELYDTGGEMALVAANRHRANLAKRVSTEIEAALLELSLEHPAWGQARISHELVLRHGFKVSPGGVRCIWQRHGMAKMEGRLKALEARAAQNGGPLTEEQLVALEGLRNQREAHGEFESECPGYCGAQDTFFVGTFKGVGQIYQQTFIDTYSKVGFAKLYTSKTSTTSADLLNDRVLPFFDEHDIPLLRVLTDRGGEFCGRPGEHHYELYLEVEGIAHTRTKAYSPQTNGICERFHRTMLDEFYRVAFRTKNYRSLEEVQADLETWLHEYNTQRPHQGRWCYGKTPMQTFTDSLPLARAKILDRLAAHERPEEKAQSNETVTD